MIHTIGHGNRSLEEFIGLLREAGILNLVDVRAYPASRRHPHFSQEPLGQSLAEAGVRYVWEGQALGGRRRPGRDSPHLALRNPAFRAYADHMATVEFRQALDRLVEIASGRSTAIMCAERLPWQCHRYLVSDSIVARGLPVRHIVSPGKTLEHTLSRLARRDDERLIYDVEAQPRLAI